MSYKAMKIDITDRQAMSALKGKPIRISANQINKGETFISLHPENAKKVEKAFLQKKGLTLNLSHGELADTAQRMSGNGFWNNVWSGIKKVWGVLKDSGALSSLADMAVAPASAYLTPAGAVAGRQLLKSTTGIGLQQQQEATRERMTKGDKYEMLRGAGIYLS